jgi:hypothetical protein
MPTLAEFLLALITDQPLSAAEKRAVTLHILRFARRVQDVEGCLDIGPRDVQDN